MKLMWTSGLIVLSFSEYCFNLTVPCKIVENLSPKLGFNLQPGCRYCLYADTYQLLALWKKLFVPQLKRFKIINPFGIAHSYIFLEIFEISGGVTFVWTMSKTDPTPKEHSVECVVCHFSQLNISFIYSELLLVKYWLYTQICYYKYSFDTRFQTDLWQL